MAMEHDQEGEKQRLPWAMAAVLLIMEAGRSRARGLRATRRRQGYRRFSRAVKLLIVKRRRFAGELRVSGGEMVDLTVGNVMVTDYGERRSGDGGDGRCCGDWAVIDEGEIGEDVQPLWLCARLPTEALRMAVGGGEMVTGRTGSEEDGGWLGGYWWFGRLCAWLSAEVRW
ncbi:alcohol dehydrogenase-like protein [Sesbania bispinosa]|nr:alcohol dehydrogenase-like protein [Sesbania bispinosa]